MGNILKLLVLVSVPLTLAGCGGQDSDLVFSNSAGAVVATATMQLPKLGSGDRDLTGSWRIISASPSFPRPAGTSGACEGSLRAGALEIDLDPGWADDNVLLSGTVRGGQSTGQWLYCTMAGGKTMGTFTLTPN